MNVKITDEERKHLDRVDYIVASLVESRTSLPAITPRQAEEVDELPWIGGDGSRLLSPKGAWIVFRDYSEDSDPHFAWGEERWKPLPFTLVVDHALNAYAKLYGSEGVTICKSGDAWLADDEGGRERGAAIRPAEAICNLILGREGIPIDEEPEDA